MITRHILIRCLALVGLWLLTLNGARAAQEDFAVWIEGVKREALARGISQATVSQALDSARPMDKVLELDRRQPEFIDTFWNYLSRRISNERVKKGREQLDKHSRLFAGLAGDYAVPPRYLVAFWAMETNFGEYTGGFPVVDALVSLAYDARRADFFRGELFAALEILDAGHIARDAMKGSWAGAMGQMQFMPSTFRHYAVDADADGRADIWGSLPDAFASAANYLTRIGWRDDETWGREVRLPKDFDWRLASLETRKPVKTWSTLGVTQADGKPLPASKVPGAILLPQGYEGPAFLVYRNFDVIMAWNRSVNYALSVALLADRLRGIPGPRGGRLADNRRMSREQAIELQTRLSHLGYDAGKPDGILGARSRAAVRAFQESAKLPADGYASLGLLEQLRLQDPAPVAAPEKSETPAMGSSVSDMRRVKFIESRHG